MRHVTAWNLIAIAPLLIAGCVDPPALGAGQEEARRCYGDCDYPDDEPPPEDPGSTLPWCFQMCTASSGCDLPCQDAFGDTNCGTHGVCVACSTAACTAGACGLQCRSGGAVRSCQDWSHDAVGDADLDGVPDTLETELARRFAPTLNLNPTDFGGSANGDLGQLYGVEAPSNVDGADWSFVVRPVRPFGDHTWLEEDYGYYETRGEVHTCRDEAFQCLEIVYLIPYNWDLGDTYAHIGEHRGDSEGYAVLVARRDPRIQEDGEPVSPRWNVPWEIARTAATAWTAYSDFAAAHMCTASDSSAMRMRVSDDPAELFVAEGKHASYFSRGACDWGSLFNSDDCDDSTFELVYLDRFGAGGPLRNAGEPSCHSHPSLDPTTRYPGSSKTSSPSGTYHVWSGARFGDSSAVSTRLTPGVIEWLSLAADPFVCLPDPEVSPTPTPAPPPAPYCSGSGQSCCETNEAGECTMCITLPQQCQ